MRRKDGMFHSKVGGHLNTIVVATMSHVFSCVDRPNNTNTARKSQFREVMGKSVVKEMSAREVEIILGLQ